MTSFKGGAERGDSGAHRPSKLAARNIKAICELEEKALAARTAGEWIGDTIARFAGRLWFIVLHVQINMLSELEASKTLEMLRALCKHYGLPEGDDPEVVQLVQPTKPATLLDELQTNLPQT